MLIAGLYDTKWGREMAIRHSPRALGASGSVNASVIFNILHNPYSTVLIYGASEGHEGVEDLCMSACNDLPVMYEDCNGVVMLVIAARRCHSCTSFCDRSCVDILRCRRCPGKELPLTISKLDIGNQVSINQTSCCSDWI